MLPENAIPLGRLDDGRQAYMRADGAIIDDRLNVIQRPEHAPTDIVDTPAGRTETPPPVRADAEQPVLVGAGARADAAASLGGRTDGGTTGARMDLDNTGGGRGSGSGAADNTAGGGTRGTGSSAADGTGRGSSGDLPPRGRGPLPPSGGILDDLGPSRGGSDPARGAGDGGAPPSRSGDGPESRDGNTAADGELTAAERKAIQDEHVRKANEDPDWFKEHYGMRDGEPFRRQESRVVDGAQLPILKTGPDGKLVAKFDLPQGPSEIRHSRTPLGPETVDPTRRPILDEAAKNSRVSVDLMNAERAFKENPSIDAQMDLDAARHSYQEQLGDTPNNSKHSERLGELAARHHAVKQLFPEAQRIVLPKTPNGANMLDDLYDLGDGRYLVVEAKGPKAGLNPPRLGSGPAANMMVKQGTRPYLDTIIDQMWKRGGRDRELADALMDALEDGKVQYVLVKGKENAGAYDGSVLEHFKIN
ncbi:hypothetical protein H9Y04_01915 [Streptomyces sp. TRM66268-LWL]|uniref:Tox-REase-7 domain-containing protein n=1 Tax=Streptomyces polyasparticus TaxID=2767826 RepID=A0ABR7SA07_9ACTN|nr:hypothetical protein [Streptomyces polyasparticus]MBC9711326.1 hypothetical protein [Streptomyces polyasparticus]